jgi:lipopolysaccharide transport system permease protein
MINYWDGIWRSRYFWMHLAMSDLRSRWRRSFFGLLWSIIQPLGMTLLLALVFSKMFHADIVTYAPYILSGIVVWEFVTACVTGGALSFVQADAYIKQCRHPLAIYTLRTVITGLVVLAFASTALFGWSVIVLPQNFGWSWLAALSIFPMLGLIFWPLATLLAYIGARFRDVPHATGLVMQALWFVSPVYFETQMFRKGGLDALVDYNPVYHLLQLVRAPLLNGEWPTAANYGFALATAAIFGLLAWMVGYEAERKVIFYL